MRFLSLITLSFIALLGVSFSILNSQVVQLEYYIGTRQLPLSLLLVLVLTLGVILGFLFSLPSILKLRLKLRRLQNLQGV